jgi:porin
MRRAANSARISNNDGAYQMQTVCWATLMMTLVIVCSKATVSGRPYATRAGRSGVFVQFEQAVQRRDPSSDRGLTAFAVAMATTAGRTVEDRFFQMGLVQKGTFRGRGDDTFGFAISEKTFSRWAMENGRAARSLAGGAGDPPRSELMMELAYGRQLTSQVRISPNIQYIVNPD